MMGRPMWLSHRIFPELSYFESNKQRNAAKDQALRAVFKDWRFWLAVVILVPTGYILEEVFSNLGTLLPRIFDPASVSVMIVMLIVLLIVWFILFAAPLILFFQFGFRPLYRRSLRIELGKAGIFICIKCGYDMRGSREKCPECGQDA